MPLKRLCSWWVNVTESSLRRPATTLDALVTPSTMRSMLGRGAKRFGTILNEEFKAEPDEEESPELPGTFVCAWKGGEEIAR